MNALLRGRVVLVVAVVLTIQEALISGLRIRGAHPDLMLLLPIAFGLAGGSERGAAMGFVSGLLADLFVGTPFGLSALVYTLIGFGIGMSEGDRLGGGWWVTPLMGTVASAAGVLLFAGLGAAVGEGHMLHDHLATVVIVVAVVNGLLTTPGVRVARWAMDLGRSGSWSTPARTSIR
ncbi:MAG TPA: rod shape-determining protein MreD [Acidimicrobiales bacterium]|nr:rod shape-determining protein MreD [Acidimicrobiales bacterium]